MALAMPIHPDLAMSFRYLTNSWVIGLPVLLPDEAAAFWAFNGEV
jgi:hypothetical protein